MRCKVYGMLIFIASLTSASAMLRYFKHCNGKGKEIQTLEPKGKLTVCFTTVDMLMDFEESMFRCTLDDDVQVIISSIKSRV